MAAILFGEIRDIHLTTLVKEVGSMIGNESRVVPIGDESSLLWS